MTCDLSPVKYVFFLMIRRPPRSTLDRSSAASDVYKRQALPPARIIPFINKNSLKRKMLQKAARSLRHILAPVSYTHLRAHETVLDLVCRLLLEKKKKMKNNINYIYSTTYTIYNKHTQVTHMCNNKQITQY